LSLAAEKREKEVRCRGEANSIGGEEAMLRPLADEVTGGGENAPAPEEDDDNEEETLPADGDDDDCCCICELITLKR